MTVHKCFKCHKIYDCTNEVVLAANTAFFARLYGFKDEDEMGKLGYSMKDPQCHESYEATCPYCAFEVIFGEKYNKEYGT